METSNASAIAAHGWRESVTVSKFSGLVVRGHGALLAARLIGAVEIPVEFQDYATAEEELADLLADNRLAHLSTTDADLLKSALGNLSPAACGPSAASRTMSSAKAASFRFRASSKASVKICIPSRRAATITTQRLAPDAIVCVPESQRAEYETAGCLHVQTHPDSIRGLTPKLNWMLDHLADDDGIIFLDDDLEYLCRCFVDRLEQNVRKVTGARLIKQILKQTASLAREAGAFFFGWESSESTIRYYSGLDPFKFTGFINGCAMGFIAGHGLRFDEEIVAKNDYDICALNAFRHRICFKDARYAFCQRETFTGSGGQSFFRNSQTEERDIAILRRKYGEVIVVGKQGGTRKRDYAGVQKVTLKLPY